MPKMELETAQRLSPFHAAQTAHNPDNTGLRFIPAAGDALPASQAAGTAGHWTVRTSTRKGYEINQIFKEPCFPYSSNL
jgi:hypothetical protein